MQTDIVKDIIEKIARTKSVDAIALAKKHAVTRQTVYRYIAQLKAEKKIESCGKNVYELVAVSYPFLYENKDLKEDVIWSRDIQPCLPPMDKSAVRAMAYCFTEMMNNAIEHSQSKSIDVCVRSTAFSTSVLIGDDGVGIFEKISKAMGLDDKKHAVLELAKGKFTTEPQSHTGEGIFFSSKIADVFYILSDGIEFIGNLKRKLDHPFVLENEAPFDAIYSTMVCFEIINDAKKDMNAVFEKYTQQPEDFGFSKTQIPVKLLEYGEQDAIFLSRSQARRLLARLENFENIVMDFEGIEEIGQGFADEIFRVFLSEHPAVRITPVNCSAAVQKMIRRVQAQ